MRANAMFRALVVGGALLAGCEDPEDSPADGAPGDGDADPVDSGAQDDPADTGAGEDTAGSAEDFVCENTDNWATCTGDGVTCCWAAGPACEPCCGHL